MTETKLPDDFAENPVPGVYMGVPNEDYHSLPGWSSSLLKVFGSKSPAHAVESRKPKDMTPQRARSLRLGRAEHTIILEPHLYASEFCILPNDIANLSKNSKAYKSGYTDFVNHEAGGREILTADDEEILFAMRDAIWSHPEAEKILSGKLKRREASVWTLREVSREIKILIKARPDLWLPGAPFDLKTSQTAHPKEYQRMIHNFGYHIQAAHYLDVLRDHDENIGDLFGHIVVEKEPPYGVSVVRIDPQAIALGRTILDNVLPKVAECEAAGVFPCYSTDIQIVGVPAYAYTQAEFDADD